MDASKRETKQTLLVWLCYLLCSFAVLISKVAHAEAVLVSDQVEITTTDMRGTLDRATRKLISTATVNITNTSDNRLIAPLHTVFIITAGTNVELSDGLGGIGEGPYGTFYLDVSSLANQAIEPGRTLSFPIEFTSSRAVAFDIELYAVIELADPDSDGDGVPDSVDACPQTAPGSTTNADGCSDDQIDTEAPSINIFTVDGSTMESSILLEGSVSDNEAVSDLLLANDQFTDTTFSVDLDGSSWSATVPLAIGSNSITVTATDINQNTSSQSITIERLNEAAIAELAIETPANGSVFAVPSLTLKGTLSSQQAYNSANVIVNGISLDLNDTTDATLKTFRYNNLVLQEGENTITVEAEIDYELYEDEALSKSVNVYYIPEEEELPLPTVTLLEPVNNSYVNQRSFYLTLQYQSYVGNATLTINNNAVDLVNPQYGTVSALLEFPEGQGQWDIEAIVTDGLGRDSTVQAQLFYDNAAPVIQLENNLQASPIENTVDEQPYVINGTVSDQQLADFKINDQTVQLVPTSNPSVFEFSVPLNLTFGEANNINLLARDYSGAETTVEYTLFLSSDVSLSMLVPPENVSLLNSGQEFEIQVAAMLEGINNGYSGRGRILQNGSVIAESNLNIGQGLVSGYINTPLEAGTYTVEIALLDGGLTLTRTARTLTVNNVAEVPLTFQKIEPANGEQGLETNTPITLYFNKAINPALLDITVRETAHGFSYVNTADAGAQGFESEGYRLVKVDIDDAVVNGGISLLPGGSVVAFYPSREFAYDSQVEVIVTYDNEEISRSRFNTRELPTFIDGSVRDQFGQAVPGIKVELVELDRINTSNSAGVFGFGYGDKSGEGLPDGRYTLQINAGLKNSDFGSLQKKIFINKGEVTDLGSVILPALNNQDTFSHLSSGMEAELAQGDLKLDASSAQVFFADGKSQGLAMALFLPTGSFSHSYDPMFMPYWLFSVQPAGIEVDGELGIDFALAKLNLIDDYIWADGAYILLVGLDPERDIIVPVGVGIVQNHRVKALRHEYSRLDYIGYAPMPGEAFSYMEAYANGDTSLDYMISQIRNLLESLSTQDQGGTQ